MEITIDNKKMWESLRNSLWHFPQEEWLIRCIDNALWDQGLEYNPETKEIESIATKPEYYKTRKEMTKESSDGELTEFESEIAHILVYVNNEPTDTDEERKRAYQKYAKNAKFFAPFLLEKARKQLQPEIDANIDKAYKNQDEVQYKNGYNKAVEDACEWLKYNFYEDDRNVVTTNYDGFDDFIDNFRKAIKGE